MTMNDNAPQAAATPLSELLRRVPSDHRLWVEHRDDEGRLLSSEHIPVGTHCHDAAGLLEGRAALAKELSHMASLMRSRKGWAKEVNPIHGDILSADFEAAAKCLDRAREALAN